MSKANRMAKLAAKGGFNLFLGVFFSTVISALGVIILARLLTPTQYGSYAIALVPAAFFGLFRDWGISYAIIRYLAKYRSESKTLETKEVIASGLVFELSLGAVLSIVSFFLAGFIAVNVFQKPEIEPFIRIASVTIFAGALVTTAQSVFVGFESMGLNSVVMICQSVLRSLIAPSLVLLGYGTAGAVSGYAAAFLIAGILGVAIVYQVFYRGIHTENYRKLDFKTSFRTMFGYALPLSVSAILGGGLGQFFNFMMAIYCTSLLIGNYQAAINFLVLVTFFQAPITTVLFPAFSKLNKEDEMETLRTIFQSSVKYASLLIIPATTLIMVLSKPLLFTVLGENYTYAPLFLAESAIIFFYTALGNIALGNFLNGQGKTEIVMKLSLIDLAVGLPLGFLLIPRFEITGLIATILVFGLPSLITGLWWIKKHFGVTVDWSSSAKILAASAVSGAITFAIASKLNFQYWAILVVGATTFLIAYLTAIPLLRAVNRDDLRNLRGMLTELGPFYYLFNLPLDFVEKLTLPPKKAHSL